MPEENNKKSPSENSDSFSKKVLISSAIIAFLFILLLILKETFNVLLLILAGTLIALFFTGLGNKIQRKTNWNNTICVGISIVTTLLLVVCLFWLIGSKVESQIAELSDTIPTMTSNLKDKLNESSLGKTILENATSDNSIKKVQGFLGQFFQSTFGVFGDVYVILFIGIFFSISPQTYTTGFVQLIPSKGQKKGKQILDKLTVQLRNWLKGKLFSMLIVFILTAIGLAIIGVPLWLVLALLAGLISFIPNFGPLIALIPAVLVGLMQSTKTAILIVVLYAVIQFIESNFITTLIQKKLINMPPALIIIAQLIMGTLTGSWGLVLATPITVIVIVLVQELYIKKIDNDFSEKD
jgi:predicted PurR-regulated permease PerM